jgi:hypothetical protein
MLEVEKYSIFGIRDSGSTNAASQSSALKVSELQKLVLGLCLVATAFMFLIPPLQSANGTQAGYEFIFTLTGPVRIDLVRLLVQLVPVGIVVALVFAEAFNSKGK